MFPTPLRRDRLNRIVWGLVKGWAQPYPAVRQAVFTPFAADLTDDEREERDVEQDRRAR